MWSIVFNSVSFVLAMEARFRKAFAMSNMNAVEFPFVLSFVHLQRFERHVKSGSRKCSIKLRPTGNDLCIPDPVYVRLEVDNFLTELVGDRSCTPSSNRARTLRWWL